MLKRAIPGLMRAYRAATGITQEELGRMTGVGQSRVSALETGIYPVSLDYLERLVNAGVIQVQLDLGGSLGDQRRRRRTGPKEGAEMA